MRNKLGIVALILCAAQLAAQNSTGSLRGIVQDSTGSRLVVAKVTIRVNDAPSGRSTAPDGHGEFRFDGLLSGEYLVSVSSRGFSDAIASVLVGVSATRDIVVTMKPSGARDAPFCSPTLHPTERPRIRLATR